MTEMEKVTTDIFFKTKQSETVPCNLFKVHKFRVSVKVIFYLHFCFSG